MQPSGEKSNLRSLGVTECLGSTDVCSKVMPVKSIYLLNVVVKQESLIKTQENKTSAASSLADSDKAIEPLYVAYRLTGRLSTGTAWRRDPRMQLYQMSQQCSNEE